MKQNNHDAGYGRLPEMAPLANPYVPFQMEAPPKYDARKGLVRGTLYPGLDLPFMGMENERMLQDTPLAQLQELGFALHELALYLDTHKNDTEALQLYRQYQHIYHDSMKEYSCKCGPMAHGIPDGNERYAWLDAPWPWEYER